MEKTGCILVLSVLSLLVGVIVGVLWQFGPELTLYIGIFVLPFILIALKVSKFSLGRCRNIVWSGLSENKLMLLTIGVILVLGLIIPTTVKITHGTTKVYVKQYSLDVNLSPHSASVTERLQYHVPPGVYGHEFYRSYYKDGPLADMGVINITCPHGFIDKIYNKPDRIELACRNDAYVKPGDYNVIFRYEIPKPYICYNDYCLFDWNAITDFKLTILNGSVRVHNANKTIVYPGEKFTKLDPGQLLEVKALVPKSFVKQYFKKVDAPISIAMSKEWTTKIAKAIYWNEELVVFLFAVVVSLIIYIVYLLFGKDPNIPGIPEVYHDLPNDWKPYEVNAYVYGDPNTIEDEGVLATLLDLARRGILKIEGSKITFLKSAEEAKLDEFEKEVYKFYYGLREYTNSPSDNTVDLREVEKKIKAITSPSEARRLNTKFENAINRMRHWKGLKKVADRKAAYLAVLGILIVWVLYALVFGGLSTNLVNSSIAGLSIGAISVTLIFGWKALFKYKKGEYKDILMWRSFGKLLSDYSLIKKYKPEDILMWGKWLVYATALGNADNVLKVMRELNIEIPNVNEVEFAYVRPSYVYAIATTRNAQLNRSSSSSGFGGGGFGGGFGGGGGGFR